VLRFIPLALLLSAGARAQTPSSALTPPEQLTVGISDEFLGQLSPDEKRLYFISNRNTSNELFWQNVQDGHVQLLFDEGADVTWPRVSPDGKAVLYISYAQRADGQLCVRALPQGDRRRCLESPAAALQAEWITPRRVLLVSRSTVAANLQAEEVSVGEALAVKPLLDRNLTSPAVSPDGRWAVYVPIERYGDRVGPSVAAHTSHRLEAVRLDAHGAPQALRIDLPGLSGQPAFSRDGRYLYVVQFLSDTNHDGLIDASDRGVLFRVPFPSAQDDAPQVAEAAFPEQLTDVSWNCQYPAPGKDRLVATCASHDGLDLYALPLTGEVPSTWDTERLDLELSLAGRRVDELLLYRHRLAREKEVSARRLFLMRLLRLHLQLDDFQAAQFYAEHLHALKDPATHGLAHSLFLLIAHRQMIRERELGRLAEDFNTQALARMKQLEPRPGDSPGAVVFEHVVHSELADSVGDTRTARRELEAARIDENTPPSVVEAYFERADALYRALDAREPLVQVGERLSRLSSLPLADRLRYARASARALVRGLPVDDASRALDRAATLEAGDTELAFAFQLFHVLIGVHDANPSHSVRDAVMALYRKQTRPDRQRAVMLEAVQRANDLGADKVVEALAEAYVEAAAPGTAERRRAERLYQDAILGRAYRRLAEGKRDAAGKDFDAVADHTTSYEAAVASMNLRLGAGAAPLALVDEYELRAGKRSAAFAHFVRAYLLTRSLPGLGGEEQAKRVEEAMGDLSAGWPELKGHVAAQAVEGALLHHRYLRTHSLGDAERANVHYLVALELAHDNPRYRAMLLRELGLLQDQAGNFRVAEGNLHDREKLPSPPDAATLEATLTRARAQLHIDDEKGAARTAEGALALVEATPLLERYLSLARDRAALYNLAAGNASRALELYTRELAELDTKSGPEADHNRLVARLAHATAALSAGAPARALEDLDAVDGMLGAPALAQTLSWPHVPREEVLRAYQLLASGLRANANRRLGQWAAAASALNTRRELLLARLRAHDQDKDVAAAALAEARLSLAEAKAQAPSLAAQGAEQALLHADLYAERTHAPVSPDTVVVLWLMTQLKLAGGSFPLDVGARLNQEHEQLTAAHDVAWRPYSRWEELYLPLLAPAQGKSP
jgi:hypothetical protein